MAAGHYSNSGNALILHQRRRVSSYRDASYDSGGEFAGLDFYRVWTHTDSKTYEFRVSGFVWEIREVNRAYTLVASGDLATVS